MGNTYNIVIETFAKPRDEYHTEEYRKSGLPVAPAIMVGDELVVQGCDIDEKKVEAAIARHLGLSQ